MDLPNKDPKTAGKNSRIFYMMIGIFLLSVVLVSVPMMIFLASNQVV